MTDSDPLQTDEVMAELTSLLRSSDSDNARIAAAKILLDRIAPKQDDEAKKHEADERDAALAQAWQLLTEFAALKHTVLRQQRELDRAGATATDNPAG